MELWVYSMYAIGAVAPHEEPHVIISIRTPGALPARVKTNAATREVLFIEFPDLDQNYKELPPEHRQGYTDDELFNARHARVILDFVERHKAHVESIIIQCEGGLSRSPAVRAALDKILNGDDTPYDGTNRLVYETLLAVASGTSG